MTDWTLYILKCQDDSYYTGITNNLDKRLTDHANGKGANICAEDRPLNSSFKKAIRTEAAHPYAKRKLKNYQETDKEALITQGR